MWFFRRSMVGSRDCAGGVEEAGARGYSGIFGATEEAEGGGRGGLGAHQGTNEHWQRIGGKERGEGRVSSWYGGRSTLDIAPAGKIWTEAEKCFGDDMR